jgi:hypothetical protein
VAARAVSRAVGAIDDVPGRRRDALIWRQGGPTGGDVPHAGADRRPDSTWQDRHA